MLNFLFRVRSRSNNTGFCWYRGSKNIQFKIFTLLNQSKQQQFVFYWISIRVLIYTNIFLTIFSQCEKNSSHSLHKKSDDTRNHLTINSHFGCFCLRKKEFFSKENSSMEKIKISEISMRNWIGWNSTKILKFWEKIWRQTYCKIFFCPSHVSHNLCRKNQMEREMSSHCDKNSAHNVGSKYRWIPLSFQPFLVFSYSELY